MVASTRIQALSNKADEISILREFLTNPNLAAELEAEVKKLNALSDEEESRHQEAKILMQQRDKLAAEIPVLQQQISTERGLHEAHLAASKEAFNQWLDSENAKLAEANAALDKRKEEADAEELRLRQKANKLKETAAQMQGLTVSVG